MTSLLHMAASVARLLSNPSKPACSATADVLLDMRSRQRQHTMRNRQQLHSANSSLHAANLCTPFVVLQVALTLSSSPPLSQCRHCSDALSQLHHSCCMCWQSTSLQHAQRSSTVSSNVVRSGIACIVTRVLPVPVARTLSLPAVC